MRLHHRIDHAPYPVERFIQLPAHETGSSSGRRTYGQLADTAQPSQAPRAQPREVPFANGDDNASGASPSAHPIRRPGGLRRARV